MNTGLLESKSSAQIEDGLEEYLAQCEATLMPTTASKNRYTLRAFIAWCRARGVESVDQITNKLYFEYLKEFARTPSAKTGRKRLRGTVRDAAVVIKTFLKWCYRHRYIDAERLYGYVVPKAKKPHVTMATSDQLNAVMGLVDEYWDITLHPAIKFWPERSHRFFRLRMKVILAIAMSTGLRLGETLGLRLVHYDKQKKLLYAVDTKTGDNRDVPVGPDLAKALRDWLEVRPGNSPTDYLVVTETGTQLATRACTRQYQRYLEFGRSRGVELPRLTMHSWRHVAINAMAQKNPEHARRMAGRSSLATTLRYLHTTSEDVRATHDQADPLAGILVNTRAVKTQKARSRKLF